MKRRPSQSYGFLQVAEVAPELRVADVEFNVAKIVAAMDRTVEPGASIILFPELSITGHTCGDLFNQSALIAGAQEVLQELAVFTKGLDLEAIVGVPLYIKGRLFNCAALIGEGAVLGVVPKQFLPKMGEFYEQR